MAERFSNQEFTAQTTPEQIHNLAERLRDRSFYAPVLIDTFFEQVEDESLTAKMDDRYNMYAIGGEIKNHPQAYIRLFWRTSSEEQALKMDISKSAPRKRENQRDSLIYGEGHQNRLTIESNGQSLGSIASFRGDGKWDQDIISDLTISFYPSRWLIAPTDPVNNFDYWLLTNFIPDFLENKVAPIARVPRLEMTGSVVIDDPEDD